MKKQIKKIIETIQRELDIWKTAYPNQSNLLNKFALKLMYEVKMTK